MLKRDYSNQLEPIIAILLCTDIALFLRTDD